MRRLAIIFASLILVLGMTSNAMAVLPNGTVLMLDPGNSPSPVITCTAGSCFSMETSPGFFLSTNISGLNGITLGAVQPASGSHSGYPDGSESPDIDNPWSFFGNTGMHQTTSPILDNGDETIDMSGWGLTWNGISIPMGGDPANFPADDGLGALSVTDGGTRFTISYACHVPLSSPSGFGGVQYAVHLEGTIKPVTGFAPEVSAVWPNSGPPGSFIFVFGYYFVHNGTQVSVNGVPAPLVHFYNENMLVFILPAGDTSGPVTVTTAGGSASSPTDFGNSVSGLYISGFVSRSGKPGNFVFVFGSGFVPGGGTTQVSVGGVSAPLVQVVNEEMLIFMVPPGAVTGPITVTTAAGSVSSDEDFVVIP